MNKKPSIELLTNPYRQIEAWYLYYLYSLDYGERCLAALQAVHDRFEAYDRLNKRHFAPTLDEWGPYNFWMDIVLTRFIAPYLAGLKERVLHKRRHPAAAIDFEAGISGTFMRFKSERQHLFDAAQPPGIDPNADGEIEALLDQSYMLDERIQMAALSRSGNPVLSILMGLNDNKVRDLYNVFVAKDENDILYRNSLSEPPVYPNYLVHQDETYPTRSPVPRNGVWMPEYNYMPMEFLFNHADNKPNRLSWRSWFSSAYHSQEGLVLGPTEYGLIPPHDPVTIAPASKGNIKSPTRWTYIEEIPPGTPGIPDNPLRLEHLRAPSTPVTHRLRVEGGGKATRSGLWRCPNQSGPEAERNVKAGDILPGGQGQKGVYLWYHTYTEPPPQRETYDQVVARYREIYQRAVVGPFLGHIW